MGIIFAACGGGEGDIGVGTAEYGKNWDKSNGLSFVMLTVAPDDEPKFILLKVLLVALLDLEDEDDTDSLSDPSSRVITSITSVISAT